MLDLAILFLSAPVWIPVCAVIAVLLKLTSEGPVLYRQQRVGLHGKLFDVLKFRTMKVNAEEELEELFYQHPELQEEWELKHKLDRDPRITVAGYLLRRTSLDELPQLLNVLNGSMSLVGPRPLPGYHLDSAPAAFARARQSVLPGLTGTWQINGRNGDIPTLIRFDGEYLANRSLAGDLLLVLKTVYVVVCLRGAR